MDETYSFPHLRGAVSTCDNGHHEALEENLKDTGDDYTFLVLKPKDEQLVGTQYFKKVDLLRFIGKKSELFK